MPALEPVIEVREVLPSALGPQRSARLEPGYYDPEEVDVRIQARDEIHPAYPDSARLKGLEGRVVVEVRVDETGTVRGVDVLDSHPPFDSYALDALRPVRFVAARRLNQPVKSRLLVEFVYSLKKSQE